MGVNWIETQISNLDHLTDVIKHGNIKFEMFDGQFSLDKTNKKGVEKKVTMVYSTLGTRQLSFPGAEVGGGSAMVGHRNRLWYTVDKVPKNILYVISLWVLPRSSLSRDHCSNVCSTLFVPWLFSLVLVAVNQEPFSSEFPPASPPDQRFAGIVRYLSLCVRPH